MPKVFVIQENHNINYTDADRFGTVVFCTSAELKMMPGSHIDAEIIRKVDATLAQYDPAVDLLIMTGNPVLMGYAFHLIYSRFGSVRILSWDGRSGRYFPKIFTHPDMDNPHST